ncbi:hypothetical protein [Nocardia sp. NPDC052566]|uniref:hypothetical protein n=1 Tax=Nocardia sp. NPDC052566 TaxID=3364330 RepID=UPI0037C8C328
MTTNTANLHIDAVGGYVGPARCYRLDPPKQFEGEAVEYVTIWLQPPFAHQSPEVGVVAATETGAAAARSVQRMPGSFVLQDNPESPDYVDGAYRMALGLLGGYAIAERTET